MNVILVPDIRIYHPIQILQLVDIFDGFVATAVGVVHMHLFDVLEHPIGSERRDLQETQATAAI